MGKKKKKKRFIPTSKLNPAVQARKLDKLAEAIAIHKKHLDAIGRSHNDYISYLGNFARHDIKNAIQSMDSILSTTEPSEFDESKIASLSSYLKVIRNTMDNFSKLVPYSTDSKFDIGTLMVAFELLCRTDMQINAIELILDYPKDSTQQLDLPFHELLQMINNLLINAVKSLEEAENKKIAVSVELDEEAVKIEFKDTGKEIEQENEENVFKYGFSTSGGSGIGLFHAQFVCNSLSGDISLTLTPDDEFKKTFTITLPISTSHGEEHSDY